MSIVVSLFVKELEEQRNNYSCLLLHVQLFPGADVIPHYNCLSEPYNAFFIFILFYFYKGSIEGANFAPPPPPQKKKKKKNVHACIFGFTFSESD